MSAAKPKVKAPFTLRVCAKTAQLYFRLTPVNGPGETFTVPCKRDNLKNFTVRA